MLVGSPAHVSPWCQRPQPSPASYRSPAVEVERKCRRARSNIPRPPQGLPRAPKGSKEALGREVVVGKGWFLELGLWF